MIRDRSAHRKLPSDERSRDHCNPSLLQEEHNFFIQRVSIFFFARPETKTDDVHGHWANQFKLRLGFDTRGQMLGLEEVVLDSPRPSFYTVIFQ